MGRLIALLLSLCAVAAGAASPELDLQRIEGITPRHYVCQHAIGRVIVDGRLDEPSWQRVPWSEYFVDITGVDQAQPRYRTRVKMLWDEDYLYVAADLEEPHVWATLTQRDAVIYHDDDFEVFIDPDGDTHQYYELEINARGTVWDLLLVKPYRDGGPAVTAWRIEGLRSATWIWGTLDDPSDVDQGWSVELALPWSVLGECSRAMAIPPEEGDRWRVNFSRVEWQVDVDGGVYSKVPGQPEDNWVWSPQGLVNMHFPEQWGYVQFTAAVAGKTPPPFVAPPEEEACRILRDIYYRERRWFTAHGRYTGVLDSLGIGHPILRNYLWPPVLEATTRQFEACLEEVLDLDQDGKISRWCIRQDSRTWKE